jgi:hypothetical protein
MNKTKGRFWGLNPLVFWQILWLLARLTARHSPAESHHNRDQPA